MRVVFVIGSALREVCGDQAALGLSFIEDAVTAPKYRLYSVDGDFAALVRDEADGRSVCGEVVEVSDERWEEIVATEPPGLTQGPVELSDGRIVSAATADPEVIASRGEDITAFGGFAAYYRERHSAG